MFKKDNKNNTSDGNYIKKDGEVKSETNQENQKKSEDNNKSMYEKLKDEIHEITEKLEECAEGIIVKNKKERNLEEEIGGVETDYDLAKKLADEDQDIWDEKPAELPAEIDGNGFETSANKLFIHSKKRNKGKRKGKLGPMTLNDENKQYKDEKPVKIKNKDGKIIEKSEVKKETMVEKLQRFKIDKENEGGMGL